MNIDARADIQLTAFAKVGLLAGPLMAGVVGVPVLKGARPSSKP